MAKPLPFIFIVVVTAVATITLGATVLLGWHTHNLSFIQIYPNFVPMQYNTALGFLFSGLSFLTLIPSPKKKYLIFYSIVTCIGTITLAQYIIDTSLGIDEMFMRHYIFIHTSHSGRMAPNTALCFSLVGISFFIFSNLNTPQKRFILMTISSTIFLLGGFSFMGYICELETAYGWTSLTHMAVHTSLGFMVIGSGMLGLLLYNIHEWFPNIQIREKLIIIFSLPLIFSIGLFSFFLLSIKNHFETKALETQSHNIIRKGENIEKLILYQEKEIRSFLITGKNQFLQKYDTSKLASHKAIDSLLVLLNKSKDQFKKLNEIRIYLDEWHINVISPEIQLKRKNNNTRDSSSFDDVTTLTQSEAREAKILSIQEKIKEFVNQENSILNKRASKSLKSKKILEQVIVFSMAILVLICLILGIILLHFILNIINKLTEATNKVKDGDFNFTLKLNSKDEIGLFIKAFNSMILSMKNSIKSAQKIAEGDFSEKLPIKSKNDSLGIAINEMSEKIQSTIKDLSLTNINLDTSLAKLKINKTNLERSNKDLEQFAYVASHDLQEPLRAVGSFSQLLAKRNQGKLDSESNEYIEFIVDGANRMRSLLEGLLSYAKISTNPKPFVSINLNKVYAEAIDTLKFLIADSHAKLTNDQLPMIMGDPILIRQVFFNLIGNAIKYCSEEAPIIHTSVTTKENEWIFSIQDNGIGIDPEFKDRIFIIFQRLQSREKYNGTGIGLAICKKSIELHGGRIWLESQINKGSTFYFSIPKYS